jgi:hypothetical protein
VGVIEMANQDWEISEIEIMASEWLLAYNKCNDAINETNAQETYSGFNNDMKSRCASAVFKEFQENKREDRRRVLNVI